MSLKSRVETVLFVTAKAMQASEIAEILSENLDEVEEALLDLIMDYSSRDGALEIDDEDGYILQVREEYADIVEKLVPVELSQAVMKTLSVIALKSQKEPVRQSYVIDLRGTSAYDHIKELLDKGLISRKRDKNGRSFNLRTTPKFKEYFKLKGDTELLSKFIDQEGVPED